MRPSAKNKIKKKLLRNNYIKDININVQRTRFPNLYAWNKPWRVDMPLRSIKLVPITSHIPTMTLFPLICIDLAREQTTLSELKWEAFKTFPVDKTSWLVDIDHVMDKRTARENRGYPRRVMVKAMDCRIIVSEFELQSRYYVHFREKYPWERYEPPYPPCHVLNSATTVLLEGWLWN